MQNRIQTVVGARVVDYEKGMAGASRATAGFKREQASAALTSKYLAHETKLLNHALKEQSRTLGALTLQWVGFKRALMTAALRLAVTGFAALTAMVGSLGGAIVLLTHQIGLLGAGLGVLGGSALASTLQGFLVFKIAMKGVGKALTTTGKQHELALKKLTPNARKFVGEMEGIRNAYRELQVITQEGLFKGLASAAHKIKPLMEPVKQAAYDTARALGYLADRAAGVFAARKGDVGKLLERNVVTMRRMGDAAINIVRSLMDVFRAADPFIGHVTRQLVTFTEKVAKLAHEARANGTLGSFFNDVRDAWDRWLRIIGNVGGTIMNVLRAAQGPATVMAKAIDTITQRWQDWTGSTKGQNFLVKYFTASNKVLGGFSKLIGALVSDIAKLTIEGGGSATKFFDQVRTHMLPMLYDLAIMLDKGAFQHLVGIFSAISDFIRASLPGIEPLVRSLGLLAQAIRAIVQTAGDLVDVLPRAAKGIGALAIGALILSGWSKLALSIKLATYAMRQYIGLTTEIPLTMSMARGFVFGRGGRNQANEFLGGHAPGSGGGGGIGSSGRAVVAEAQAWAGRPRPERSQLGRATRTGLHGPYSGVMQDPVTGRFVRGGSTPWTPPTSSIITRRNAKGQFASPSDVTGGRYAAYQEQLRTGVLGQGKRGGKLAGIKMAIGDMVGTAAGSKMAGALGRGAGLAAKFTGGLMALNGAMQFLGSRATTFKGRMQDMLSGMTFGLFKTNEERQTQRAAEISNALQGGSLSRGDLGAKVARGVGSHRVGVRGPGGAQRSAGGEQAASKQFVMGKLNFFKGEDRTAAKQLIDHLRKAGDLSVEAASKFKQYIDAVGKGAVATKGAGREIALAFKAVRDSGGQNLDRIKSQVTATSSVINGELGKGTKDATAALAHNFRTAAGAVRTSMQAGTISTKDGVAAIRSYLISALTEMNPSWNRKQAGRYLHDRDPLTNKPINGDTNSKVGKQRGGGIHTLAGKPGPDSVNFVAAPGEDVAVFTRHQRAIADAYIPGGLHGLFSNVRTEHNKPAPFAKGGSPTLKGYKVAMGGMVGGLAQGAVDKFHDAAATKLSQAASDLSAAAGGIGGGGGGGSTTGLSAHVLRALAWARGHGWHGGVNSGFRSYASQKVLWDGAPGNGLVRGISVAAPGTSSHESGNAVDVSDIPGFQRAMASAPPGARLLWRGSSDPVHFSVNGRQRGGLIHALSGYVSQPPRNSGYPTVSPGDAVQHLAGKGGKKGRKGGKPTASHLDLPGVHALKAARRKLRRKLPRWMRDLGRFTGLGTAGDWAESLLPKSLAGSQTTGVRLDAAYGAVSDRYGLTADTDSADVVAAHTRDLLTRLTGSADGSYSELGEGYLSTFAPPQMTGGGIMGNILDQMRGYGAGIVNATANRPFLLSQMSKLADVFKARKRVYDTLGRHMSDMRKGNPSWSDAVHNNEEQIGTYEDYLRAQQKRGTTSKLPAGDRKDMIDVRNRIKELRKENTHLRKTKPGTVGMSRENKRRYLTISSDRDRAGQYLTAIAGNTDSVVNATSGSLYGDVKDRYSSLMSNRDSWRGSYTSLWSDYQSRSSDAYGLLHPGKSNRDRELAALETERADAAERSLAISNKLSGVFEGFAPLLGMRMVGAFAHGGVVNETGMALVHQGETIITNPEGPYGNRAGGNVNGKGGGGGDVSLTIAGDLAPLMRLIDARIAGTAAKVVSQELGAAQRRMTVSPGRG